MVSIGKKVILFIVPLTFTICLFILFTRKSCAIFDELLIIEAPDSYANIYGKHSVGQIFIPHYPKLCKLGFFIFKDKLKNKDLILHIKSVDTNAELLKLTVRGQDLYNKRYPFKLPPLNTEKGSLYFFEFEPLDYQLTRPLYFYLESPDSDEQNPVRIGAWQNIFRRGNAGGSSYLNGVVWNKHLAIHNFYQLAETPYGIIRKIIKRVSQDLVFLIFYFSLCLLLIIGILVISYKERAL